MSDVKDEWLHTVSADQSKNNVLNDKSLKYFFQTSVPVPAGVYQLLDMGGGRGKYADGG